MGCVSGNSCGRWSGRSGDRGGIPGVGPGWGLGEGWGAGDGCGEGTGSVGFIGPAWLIIGFLRGVSMPRQRAGGVTVPMARNDPCMGAFAARSQCIGDGREEAMIRRHLLNPASAASILASKAGRDDAILSDLRDFARDIGLGGAAAMSKDELVEGLRQHYQLQTLLAARLPSDARSLR